jgi:hypothetical protein
MGERIHLIEEFIAPSKLISTLSLNESTRKILYEGKEYNTVEAYEFPVWRLDQENKNSRIYTTKLAEKVIKEGKWSYGLVDHPDKEGSAKDIWAIEKNPHIREGIMYVDFYLVGDWGKSTAKDILNVPGAGIGLSSSAYGEINRDKTVDTETFELERYADAVLNPSMDVFGFGNNIVKQESTIEQNINKLEEEFKIGNEVKAPSMQNNRTYIIDDKFEDSRGNIWYEVHCKDDPSIHNEFKEIELIKESKQINKEGSMNKKFSVEEKTFRYSIKNLIKEAEGKVDLEEKQNSYKEIIQWFEDVDYANELKEEVNKKIDEIDKQIKELAKKGIKTDNLLETEKNLKKVNEELVQSLEAVGKKYDVASKMLDGLKVFSNKMKELYSNQKLKANGMIEVKEYNDNLKLVEDLKKSIDENKVTNDSLLKENKNLKSELLKTKDELKESKKFNNIRNIQLEATEDFKALQNKQKEDALKEAEDTNRKNRLIQEERNGLHITESEEITRYFDDLVESNEHYAEYADIILGQKTLYEAQMKVMKIKEFIDKSYVRKDTKLQENTIPTYKVGRDNQRSITDIRSIRRDGYI